MWLGIVMNGIILSVGIIVIYLVGLSHYCNTLFPVMTGNDAEDAVMASSLRKTRTAAFIGVVWSENVRAYTSRSFDRPVWRELCSNGAGREAGNAVFCVSEEKFHALVLEGAGSVSGIL